MKKVSGRILVAGASGFLGVELVRQLLACGYSVLAHYRRNELPEPLQELQGEYGQNLQFWQQDLSQAGFVLPEIGQDSITGVINLASLVFDWGAESLFRQACLDTLTHLQEAMLRAGHCRRFLHVSTVMVYGFGPHRGSREDIGPYYQPLQEFYPKYKWQAEQVAQAFPRPWELVIARPGVVYGETDVVKSHKLVEVTEQGINVLVDRGKHLISMIHVCDAARGLIAVFENGGSGECYNLVSPEQSTWKDIFDQIAALYGCKVPRIWVPGWLAYMVAALNEGVYRFFRLAQAPLLTRYRIKQVMYDARFSHRKAEEELGFHCQISLHEGLSEVVLAYKKAQK